MMMSTYEREAILTNNETVWNVEKAPEPYTFVSDWT